MTGVGITMSTLHVHTAWYIATHCGYSAKLVLMIFIVETVHKRW